jgi:ribosome maturation factor RimP
MVSPLVVQCLQRVLELEDDIELVDAIMSGSEARGRLRVFIWKPTGITIDDCHRISRRLLREFDQTPGLEQGLALEVSSPGLDRALTDRRDFERSIGEIIRLWVVEEGGPEQEVTGRLTEVESESLLLDPVPPRPGDKGKTGEQVSPFRVPLAKVRQGTIEVIL